MAPGKMTLANMRIDVAPEGVIAAYREIWSEAFPDEPPPLS